jgi:hypothetical protein
MGPGVGRPVFEFHINSRQIILCLTFGRRATGASVVSLRPLPSPLLFYAVDSDLCAQRLWGALKMLVFRRRSMRCLG